MREKGDIKPLLEVNGVPIIERVIKNLRTGGVDEFFVITGYRGTKVRSFLDILAERENISITHIINEDWERSNGISVLKAKDVIKGPFILTMSDHLFDPAIITSLAAHDHEPGTVTLCVDYNIENPVVDLDDVTRVNCTRSHIENIGKVIKDYNAFDTGIFYCHDVMFEALELSAREGDDSISGAMNILGSMDKARTFDIEGRLWLDVDDPTAYGKAIVYVDAGRL